MANANSILEAPAPSQPGELAISSLEPVSLGGVKQWVMIRGQKRSNPVLLFIHGGPGATDMTAVKHYLGELEEDFVVVTWDQRGQGKSFSPWIPRETMTHAQLLADAHELILGLRERFRVEKIFLVAHSWGTIIGTWLAQRYPELVHAYVGMSQWTDGVERERESYRLILDWARRTGNRRAVKELEAQGLPPYAGSDAIKKVGLLKKWLVKSGGMVHGQDSMGLIARPLLASRDYSLLDKLSLILSFMRSMEWFWPEAMGIDLAATAREFKVPVYLVSGRHDFNMPLPLAERYFQLLDAPYKEHVVFEHSAHAPSLEEPARFVALMRQVRAQGL